MQTFGDRANFHPHVHALATRAGWTAGGEWIAVPYVDERAAEELFRHKVLGLLRRRGLVSGERIELLLSWRHSGFSVHNRVFAHPGNGSEFEALVRYVMRSPINLSRLRFTPGAKDVVYTPVYSNRARGQRRKAEGQFEADGSLEAEAPLAPERAALRRRWANLIRRVYEVDPLLCPRCGAEMRVIGFITEPSVVKHILDHIRRRDRASRAPPRVRPPAIGPSAASDRFALARLARLG